MRYLTQARHAGTHARQHRMKPLAIAIAEDEWFIAEYLSGELAALAIRSWAEPKPAMS